jgi:outer membrane protein assembly factor BamE (lipoprotein component of BamABCDE complex)
MTSRARMGVALAFAVCISGCMTQGSTIPTAVVTPARTKVISPDRMVDAVAIGRSTKADVMAALGETLVISFDTGYEVWVYRLASHRPAKAAPAQRIARTGPETPGTTAEFVVLFGPSGVVAKTRIRPDTQRSDDG